PALIHGWHGLGIVGGVAGRPVAVHPGENGLARAELARPQRRGYGRRGKDGENDDRRESGEHAVHIPSTSAAKTPAEIDQTGGTISWARARKNVSGSRRIRHMSDFTASRVSL